MKISLLLNLALILGLGAAWHLKQEESQRIHALEEKLNRLQTRLSGEKSAEEAELARLSALLKTREDALAEIQANLTRAGNFGQVREELPLLKSKLADHKQTEKEIERQLKALRTQEADLKAHAKIALSQQKTAQAMNDREYGVAIRQHEAAVHSLAEQAGALKKPAGRDPTVKAQLDQVSAQLQDERNAVQALRDQRSALAQQGGQTTNQAESVTQDQSERYHSAQADLEARISQEKKAIADYQSEVNEDQGARDARKQELARMTAAAQDLRAQIASLKSEIAGHEKKLQELSSG